MIEYMMPPVKRGKFKSIGRGCKISPDALIIGYENIEIGDNVRIDAGVIILASKGYLKLGSHIHLACGSYFLCGGGIEIQDHCTVSFGSRFVSASDCFDGSALIGPNIPEKYTKVSKKPILMQRLSHVTTGCILLPGSILMEGAVLGASSQLRNDQTIPPFSIAFGIPAYPKIKRGRECVQLALEFEREWNAVPKE